MSLPLLLGAFLRRDAAIARSYRFALFFELSAAVTMALLFFFLSRVVSPTALVAHGVASGKYFPFVLVGVASLGVFDTSMLGASAQLRSDQVNGTLEPLLATPAPAWAIVGAGAAYDVVRAVLLAAATLCFGALALGVPFSGGVGGVLLAIGILVPAMVMTLGAGLLLAAVTVLIRRADRVSHFAAIIVSLGCGVYYPVSVLPSPLRGIAEALPPKWFLDLERASLFGGDFVLWKLAGLVGAAALLAVVGAAGLDGALRRARRTGTLTHY